MMNNLNASTIVDMNMSGIFPCGGNGTVPEETFQLSNLGYILFQFLMGVFIGFGNVLVLVAFYKFKELRTSLNVYVVALSLADLTVAFIAIPIHIAIFVFPVIKKVFIICILRYSILVISSGSSAYLLIVIAIDRYVAIEKPLRYMTIMTTGKAKLISIGVLLYTLSLSLIPLLGWNQWTPCIECTFSVVLPRMYLTWIMTNLFVGCVFVAILNIKIFFTANKAAAGIHARIVSFPGQTSVANGKSFIQNKTAMKALLMMFSAFAVCLLPHAVFTMWELYALDKTDREQYNALRMATTMIGLINCGLNPLIYHRRIPEFNTAFRTILGLKAKPSGIKTPQQVSGMGQSDKQLHLHADHPQ